MTRVTSVPQGGSVRLARYPGGDKVLRTLRSGYGRISWLTGSWDALALNKRVSHGAYLLHPDDALYIRAVQALDPEADVSDYVLSLLTNAPKEGTDHVQTP